MEPSLEAGDDVSAEIGQDHDVTAASEDPEPGDPVAEDSGTEDPEPEDSEPEYPEPEDLGTEDPDSEGPGTDNAESAPSDSASDAGSEATELREPDDPGDQVATDLPAGEDHSTVADPGAEPTTEADPPIDPALMVLEQSEDAETGRTSSPAETPGHPLALEPTAILDESEGASDVELHGVEAAEVSDWTRPVAAPDDAAVEAPDPIAESSAEPRDPAHPDHDPDAIDHGAPSDPVELDDEGPAVETALDGRDAERPPEGAADGGESAPVDDEADEPGGPTSPDATLSPGTDGEAPVSDEALAASGTQDLPSDDDAEDSQSDASLLAAGDPALASRPPGGPEEGELSDEAEGADGSVAGQDHGSEAADDFRAPLSDEAGTEATNDSSEDERDGLSEGGPATTEASEPDADPPSGAASTEAQTEDAQSEDAQSEDAQSEDAQSEDAQSEDAQSEDAQSEGVPVGPLSHPGEDATVEGSPTPRSRDGGVTGPVSPTRPLRQVPAPRTPPRRRLGERVGREAIQVAVLVVLALVCAGLIVAVVEKTQHDAAVAAREAAAYTPPPLPTPAPSPSRSPIGTAGGPLVAIVGDETVTRAATGVSTTSRWPQIVAKSLPARVVELASASSGYAAGPSTGTTYSVLAQQVPTDADVVIFVGGGNDRSVAPLSLARAATEAYKAAHQRAPKATLIVVGPIIRGGADSATITSIRNSLRASARIAGATWVDPVRAAWLGGSGPSSATRLSSADERAIAARVGKVISAHVR